MVGERIRRFLNADPDDASVRYRVATLGAVLAAVVCAVSQKAVTVSSGIAAFILVAAGFAVSYRRRRSRNIALKGILAVGLITAFAAFLQAVRGAATVDDARAPLVALFLWVQVLHSFDVPRARDLTFSVASSVALVALAGSLAFSGGFIWLVLLYACFLLVALVFGHEAELRAELGAGPAREIRSTSGVRASTFARPAAALLAVTMLGTAVVFVFLPRVSGTQIASLPFSLAQRTGIPGFVGGVVHPERPGGGGGNGGGGGTDPDVYFGYGESVDLRLRGKLADDLVLRVRTPRPSLYRGQVFDVYQDGKWTSSDAELDEVRGTGEDPIPIPRALTDSAGGPELVQTFYVERPLPNIIFHAYRADEVYVSSTVLRVDEFSSIRLPYTLETDTIYSVVSHVPVVDPDTLRLAPPVNTAHPEMAPFLQLPESLSGRFRDLAQEITAPHYAPADKATAVQDWLKANKRYRLDISPDPPGRDPVDVFVFDRDEGFCEQIAATMTLMLRASGVPARLVTGFGPGERNLFTGYWEVKNSNAHAWVEVFYPGQGWVPYDPTFGVPVSTAANTTFMLAPLRHLAKVIAPLSALRDAAGAIGRFASFSPLLAAFAALVLLAGAGGLGVRLYRARSARFAAIGGDRDRVVRGWLEVEAALRRRGYTRDTHETALEFANRTAPLVDQDEVELRELTTAFGRLRYGPTPSDEEFERWEGRTRHAARTLARARDR